MPTRPIVTPFIMDEFFPALADFRPDWALNAPGLPDGDRLARMAAIYRPLPGLVAAAVGRGERAIHVGGDCTAAIGVVAGLQRAGIAPTLVWLDAHGDFNTPASSPSGLLLGMPLAMLVGDGDQAIVRATGATPLPAGSVYLADGRALDPLEAERVAASDLHHLPDPANLPRALPPGPLYIHIDADILSPRDAPAMAFPAPGGPRLAALQGVLRALRDGWPVVACSLAVWDFAADRDRATARACLGLLESFLPDAG